MAHFPSQLPQTSASAPQEISCCEGLVKIVLVVAVSILFGGVGGFVAFSLTQKVLTAAITSSVIFITTGGVTWTIVAYPPQKEAVKPSFVSSNVNPIFVRVPDRRAPRVPLVLCNAQVSPDTSKVTVEEKQLLPALSTDDQNDLLDKMLDELDGMRGSKTISDYQSFILDYIKVLTPKMRDRLVKRVALKHNEILRSFLKDSLKYSLTVCREVLFVDKLRNTIKQPSSILYSFSGNTSRNDAIAYSLSNLLQKEITRGDLSSFRSLDEIAQHYQVTIILYEGSAELAGENEDDIQFVETENDIKIEVRTFNEKKEAQIFVATFNSGALSIFDSQVRRTSLKA